MRGCGERIAGGTYLTTQVRNGTVSWTVRGKDGTLKQAQRPLYAFVNDPPIPVDMKELSLAAQGMTLRQRTYPDGSLALNADGEPIWDAYDLVGETFYPTFPDFFEETLVKGTSRRNEDESEWVKMSIDSAVHYIFAKGTLVNVHLFHTERMTSCIHDHEEHDVIPVGMEDFAPMCASLLWETITPKRGDTQGSGREFTRVRPGGLFYPAWRPLVDPEWQHAICLTLPVTRFEVVKDELTGSHQSPLEILATLGNGIPYQLTEA